MCTQVQHTYVWASPGKEQRTHKNNHVEFSCSETSNSGAQAPGRQQKSSQDAKTGPKFQAAPHLSATHFPPAYGAGAAKNFCLKGAGFTSIQTCVLISGVSTLP